MVPVVGFDSVVLVSKVNSTMKQRRFIRSIEESKSGSVRGRERATERERKRTHDKI